jgi:PAS domain S-box-containing protein
MLRDVPGVVPLKAPTLDLAIVLGGVSAGITVQDASGQVLYANDVAAELSGFPSAAEMLEATPEELVDRFLLIDEAGEPFDRDRLTGRRVLQGATPEPVLIGFRVADGSERWSMLHATAAVLADGRTVAVNTFHDVTPRVEFERQTRERERRFREMAEHRRRAEDRLESVLREMPVGVILVDAGNGDRVVRHVRTSRGEWIDGHCTERADDGSWTGAAVPRQGVVGDGSVDGSAHPRHRGRGPRRRAQTVAD